MNLSQIQQSEWLRWAASGAFVLAAHAGAATVAAGWSTPVFSPDRAGGAIILDLAPIESAPWTPPEDVAEGPAQNQSDPSPASAPNLAETVAQVSARILPPSAETKAEMRHDEPERIEPVTAPAPDVTLSLPQAQRAEAAPMSSLPAAPAIAVPSTTAPRPAAHIGATAAAPATGQPMAEPAAVSSWKGQVVARLERNKRYPAEAQARREQGLAQLAFSIDRTGRLVSSRIARSSGSAPLDHEALALAERAQPFPPPPRGLPGDPIDLIVPIRFNMR